MPRSCAVSSIMSRTHDFVRTYMQTKRESGLGRSASEHELAKAATASRIERSWAKPAKGEVYKKVPTHDGQLEKTEGSDACDHGDSHIRRKYGDYNWGRNVGGGRELQVSPTSGGKGGLPSSWRFADSPRARLAASFADLSLIHI